LHAGGGRETITSPGLIIMCKKNFGLRITRIVYSADYRDCTKAANGNLATKHNFVFNMNVREMSVDVRGFNRC